MSKEKETPLQMVLRLRDELKAAKAEVARLDQRIAELSVELARAREARDEMQAKYDRLKLARAYGWDEESKAGATKRISAIVREIDSCLALLSKIE